MASTKSCDLDIFVAVKRYKHRVTIRTFLILSKGSNTELRFGHFSFCQKAYTLVAIRTFWFRSKGSNSELRFGYFRYDRKVLAQSCDSNIFVFVKRLQHRVAIRTFSFLSKGSNSELRYIFSFEGIVCRASWLACIKC